MKKSKLPGAQFFDEAKKNKKKTIDLIFKETKEHIDNYYNSQKCGAHELLETLKQMKILELFNNQIVTTVALGYLSFAVTFYAEHIITNIDKVEKIFLEIKDLNLLLAIFVLIIVFAFLFGIFFFFFKWLATDVLNLMNNDYVTFIMPYEKHVIIQKLKNADNEIKTLLEECEKGS